MPKCAARFVDLDPPPRPPAMQVLRDFAGRMQQSFVVGGAGWAAYITAALISVRFRTSLNLAR